MVCARLCPYAGCGCASDAGVGNLNITNLKISLGCHAIPVIPHISVPDFLLLPGHSFHSKMSNMEREKAKNPPPYVFLTDVRFNNVSWTLFDDFGV